MGIGRVALMCWSGWEYCVHRATGDIILGGRGLGAVGLFLWAWTSYARCRFAGGRGINSLDWVAGDRHNRIREDVGSTQLVYFRAVGIVCMAWIR